MDSEQGLCESSQKVCEFVKKQRRAWKAGVQLPRPAGPHAADLLVNCLARNQTLQGRHSVSDGIPFPLVCLHLISVTRSLCHQKRKTLHPVSKMSKKSGKTGSFMESPRLESHCQNDPWDPGTLNGFKQDSDMVRFELQKHPSGSMEKGD